MANPFYQSLQKSTMPNVNISMKDAYQMLNSSNPMQLFTSLVGKNPQFKPILDMLNQGVSPQSLFNSLCAQRGIDPNNFIKSITG